MRTSVFLYKQSIFKHGHSLVLLVEVGIAMASRSDAVIRFVYIDINQRVSSDISLYTLRLCTTIVGLDRTLSPTRRTVSTESRGEVPRDVFTEYEATELEEFPLATTLEVEKYMDIKCSTQVICSGKRERYVDLYMFHSVSLVIL